MSILLIGALGLAIDGGQMYAHRQMAQAAADAAAQAGIMSIFDGTNATSAHPFGTGTPPIASSACTTTDARTPCVYARDNGFGGTTADTVTLSFPATVSGVTLSSVSVPAFAVTVQRTLKTGLIRFVGAAGHCPPSRPRPRPGLVGAVSPDCVYALDPSAQNAFQATNGADGGVKRLRDRGRFHQQRRLNRKRWIGGHRIGDFGSGRRLDQQWRKHHACSYHRSGGGRRSVRLIAGAGSWRLRPTNYSPGWGTCGTHPRNLLRRNQHLATARRKLRSPRALTSSMAGRSHLVGGTTETGTGVMFYLTGTNATYGSVNISNGASATFSAQTTGPYTGDSVFQDRTITSAVNATFYRRRLP